MNSQNTKVCAGQSFSVAVIPNSERKRKSEMIIVTLNTQEHDVQYSIKHLFSQTLKVGYKIPSSFIIVVINCNSNLTTYH